MSNRHLDENRHHATYSTRVTTSGRHGSRRRLRFLTPVLCLATFGVVAVGQGISSVMFSDSSKTYLGGSPGSRNLETSSAVIPPGVDTAGCPNGRLFVTNAGRWLTQTDLPIPTSGTPVVKASQLDPLVPLGNKIASQEVNGTCQIDAASPQFEYGGAGDDTHIIRVGSQPGSLIIGFTGYHYGSVGVGKPPLQSDILIPNTNPPIAVAKKGSCSWVISAVNFVTKSDDCGQHWQTATVSVNNGPSNIINGPFDQGCGNMDMSMLYRDPFSPGHEVYAMGGSGNKCTGGVSYSLLYRSDDQGVAWKRVFRFFQTANQNIAIYTPSLTATPGGTLVAFGCTLGGTRPALFYSRDRGEHFQQVALPSTLPDCGALPSEQVPERLSRNAPAFASASFAATSPDGLYDSVRLLYSVLQPAGVGGTSRQVIQLAMADIPRPTPSARPRPGFSTPPQPVVTQGESIPADASRSVLRASFIEPDGFSAPGTPRSALLWWQEGVVGAAPTAPEPYFTLYRVVTGRDTLSNVYYLSANNGVASGFKTDYLMNEAWVRWAGDYDRGSFFQPANEPPQFLAQWSQTHACTDAVVHFNGVKVDVPKFSGWGVVGDESTFSGAPAVVSAGADKLEVFVRAGDGSVKSLKLNGGSWQSVWKSWGGNIKSPPAVASRGDGRVDVFGVGQNDHVWHLALLNDAVEAGWHDLGGETFADQPGAASTGPGKVTVFGRRLSDGRVLSMSWEGGWTSWKPVGSGVASGGVAAVSWGADRLDVFARGLNGHLWHYASDKGVPQTNADGSWQDLGGNLAPSSTPAAASNGPGKLHVFVTHGGAWDSIDYLQYGGRWGDWVNIGGGVNGSPGAATMKGVTRSTYAAVRGLNNRLWVATR